MSVPPLGAPEQVLLDDVTRRQLEQTLVPSPNVTSLTDHRASGFVDRLRPAQAGLLADVAEVFHVNSKLIRAAPPVRYDPEQARSVREWYFATCVGLREEDLTPAAARVRIPHRDLPGHVASTLALFATGGPLVRLLYHVDLGVLLPGAGAEDRMLVCRQAPGTDHLWVEHHLDEPGRRRLARALADPQQEGLLGQYPTYLVVGVPWRAMLFEGPRGYRRMLMDAGVLLNALGATTQATGRVPVPVFDFYDDELDGLLGNDGVERSVVAMLVAQPTEGEAADGRRE